MARGRIGPIVVALTLAVGVVRAQDDPWAKGKSKTKVDEPWPSTSSSKSSSKSTSPSALPSTSVTEPWSTGATSASPLSDVESPWNDSSPSLPSAPPPRRPVGAIAAVRKVVFEPDESHPTRIQIHGSFTLWVGSPFDYGAIERGYMYFECPAGRAEECRRQWKQVEAAIDSPHCVNGTHVIEAANLHCKRLNAPIAATDVTDDEPYEPGPELRMKRRYYGWQVMAAIYPSQVIFLVGITSESSTVAWLGLTGSLLGGTVVHWGHGHYLRGVASAALEFGLPIGVAGIFGLIGYAAAGGRETSAHALPQEVNTAMLIGLVIGALATPIVDGAFGYDEPERPGDGTARGAAQNDVAWTRRIGPRIAVDAHKLTLGFGGSF